VEEDEELSRESRDAKKNAKWDKKMADFHAMVGRFPENESEAAGHHIESRVANAHTMPFEEAQKYAQQGIIDHMTTKGSGKKKMAVVVFKKNKKPPEIH
jgi:hypothetical protein